MRLVILNDRDRDLILAAKDEVVRNDYYDWEKYLQGITGIFVDLGNTDVMDLEEMYPSLEALNRALVKRYGGKITSYLNEARDDEIGNVTLMVDAGEKARVMMLAVDYMAASVEPFDLSAFTGDTSSHDGLIAEIIGDRL